MITFTLNGVTYELDLNRFGWPETMEMWNLTRMTLPEYSTGLLTLTDPRAIGFAVYLAKVRAGETVNFEELDFDVLEFTSTAQIVDKNEDNNESQHQEDTTVSEEASEE